MILQDSIQPSPSMMDLSVLGTESAIILKQNLNSPRCLLDILALPELAEAVLEYLSPAHIRQLRLVSIRLCEVCRPHFFITLDIPVYESLKDIVSLTTCGYLVRSIELYHSSLTSLSLCNLSKSAFDGLDTLFRALPNLQHLSIRLLEQFSMKHRLNHFFRTVARLGTGLRSLSVKNGPIVSLPLKWESLICLFTACTKLKALALANVSFIDENDPVYLDWMDTDTVEPLSTASRVGNNTLTSDLSDLDQGHVEPQDWREHSQCSPFPQDQLQQDHPPEFSRVRSLELSSCEMDLEHIRGFIQTLPALTSLKLHFGSGVWAPLFLSSLGHQASFPSLRRLKLSSFSPIEQPVLIGFLRCTPFLQDLYISGEWVSQDNSLMEVAEVCKAIGIRFRKLEMLYYGNCPQHEMIEFLKSECCQELEELGLEQPADCIILEKATQMHETVTETLSLATSTTETSDSLNRVTNSLSPTTPISPLSLGHSTNTLPNNHNSQLSLEPTLGQSAHGRRNPANTPIHQGPTLSDQPTSTSPTPQNLAVFAWFSFSKSLTSLQLTGGTQKTADQEMTLALNRILRQLPRLVDLAIGIQLQSYDLFEGLGRCPSSHQKAGAPGINQSTTSELVDNAPKDTSGDDCTGYEIPTPANGYDSWLNERPFLQSLSISFADHSLHQPANLDVQIVQRFCFLESLQLADNEDLARHAPEIRIWQQSLRPGLQVKFRTAPLHFSRLWHD